MALEFTAQFPVVDSRMDSAHPSFLEGMVNLVFLDCTCRMDTDDCGVHILCGLVKQVQQYAENAEKE